MITVILPEWIGWLLVGVAGLHVVNWILEAYLSYLKYKLEKLK